MNDNARKEDKETLSNDDKELIRLGKIYKKRLRNRKYFALANIIVFASIFGITSAGGPERVLKSFETNTLGRTRIVVDSENSLKPAGDVQEDMIYQEIEDTFGFYPVRLNYFPEGVEFQEAHIGKEIQGAQIIYGSDEKVKISYFIRPNYRLSSLGIDVEDTLLDEYQIENDNCTISIKEYQVQGLKNSRWHASFVYREAQYIIMGMDMEKEEFECILKHLYFA